MTRFAPLCLALALAAPAVAQEAASKTPEAAFPSDNARSAMPAEAVPAAEAAALAAPPAKAAPAKPAPDQEEAAPKAELRKEEPLPRVEPRKEEPVEKPAAKKPKPAAAASGGSAGIEAEWRFLKESAEEKASEVLEASIEDVETFAQRHPEHPMAAEAQSLLAALYQKKGEYPASLVALLRLLYEYPDSKLSLQSKSAFLELAEKKLGRKLKGFAGEMVKTPESADKADRLAGMLQKLSGELGEALYEPTVREIRRFQVRFPEYREADRVQWSLARLHEKRGKHSAALLAYRKLLAVYPESGFRPKSLFAAGGLYAERLKDYKKAIEVYQDLVEKYPEASEVLPSLEKTAQLFADRLKQYELAVEIDEKIIKLFPKTEGALKAFNDEARLQRDKLSQPAEAIKTYRRLAEQFRYPAALEGLRSAAVIARKDLKDYNQEIELRRKIAADFPNTQEAAPELFTVAEIFEDDLDDSDKAIAAYRDVDAKFPGTKQARKALDRVAKLEKKKR